MKGRLAALCLALLAVPCLADSPLDRLTLRSEGLGWEAVGLEIGPSAPQISRAGAA